MKTNLVVSVPWIVQVCAWADSLSLVSGLLGPELTVLGAVAPEVTTLEAPLDVVAGSVSLLVAIVPPPAAASFS